MKIFLVLAACLLILHAVQVNSQLCDCPNTMEPVCGRDKRTYPNACSIKCAKMSIAHYGECKRRS